MAAVKYISRRSIWSGHVIDFEYQITLQLSALNRQRVPVRKTAIAIDGTQETILLRSDVVWNISTRPITGSDAERMREFLDSVEGGELFYFDPQNDSFASPDDYRAAIITSNGYTENRAVRRGTANPYVTGDYFTFTFSLREI